jgi:uncharacterized GH25 family protein
MKKQLKMLFILLIMAFSVFNFANRTLFTFVNATYVEGPITQDTIWTRVDSPFVLSKDIMVYPNATLTIESGVEVRFGGDFSIIVEGQLIANGTQDRMITFASNKYQPETGDWGTIEFSGKQPSLLAYCSITYAKTGITTKNSVVEIKNSIISNNDHYGISIENSTVKIRANEIANNSLSGIYISGNNHVTIQNNTIKTNADGILLDGTTSSGINISQNIVLSNTQSGIHLNANAYNNLTILHNILSANKWGFYISGQPSTHITNNSISYNKIGLLYAAGQNHQAHWNNITNNIMGMDVSPAIGSSSVYVEVTDSVGMRAMSNTAIVSVNGAFFASISPSSATLAAGQSQLFNSSVSGGTLPYSYQWYLNDTAVPGATGSLWTFTPSSSGLYSVYVKVTDYVGMEATSDTAAVSVNGAFFASISPGSATLAAGQSQLFNSSVSGGTPPYCYQWYLDGVPVSGATNSTWTFTSSASAEVVNATYNYWGDESGPYHVSLNPAGKGNPVGGNGMDLDFIFFCTAPIGYIDHHPTAWLWADKKVVSPNQLVTFFATNSSNDRQRRVDQYFFDFGDGQNSGWTTLSVFVHNYTSVGTYNAAVKVMDDFGVVSNNPASWAINCQSLQPLTVSLIPSSLVISSGGQVSATVQVRNTSSPMDNANVVLFSILGGRFSATSGSTNRSGYFTTTFSAPNVTSITNVRIVASASKAGYADGSDYAYLMVWPTLMVNITPNPGAIKSEANTNITISAMSGGAPVPAATVNVSSNSTGSFDRTMDVTDANGTCTFVFTAPQTSTPLEISISATATKKGYLDGQGQALLTIEPKVLLVQIWQSPTVINSESTADVAVSVMSGGVPVSAANVTVSSNSTGRFNLIIGVTDANGTYTFVFTAPQTSTPLEINIAATATKSGYLDGQGQALLTIEPKVLLVQVSPSSATVNSEMPSNVTVRVVYDASPVPNATVNLSFASSVVGGSFSPTNATTDANGECTFVFTAPQVMTPTNITITATATKTGYANGTDRTTITVNLGTLNVQVTANPATFEPKAISNVTVHVTYNARPVANAVVTVSSEVNGGFSVTTRTTDENGDCKFVFTAPQTNVELPIVIVANATKFGYISENGEITITVTPEAAGGGWSIMTMLLILIPIIIAVVVVILIKLKIIVISAGEEKQW